MKATPSCRAFLNNLVKRIQGQIEAAEVGELDELERMVRSMDSTLNWGDAGADLLGAITKRREEAGLGQEGLEPEGGASSWRQRAFPGW